MVGMPRLFIDDQPLTDEEQLLVIVALLDAKNSYALKTEKYAKNATVESWLRAEHDHDIVEDLAMRISGRKDAVKEFIRDQLSGVATPQQRKRRIRFGRSSQPTRP